MRERIMEATEELIIENVNTFEKLYPHWYTFKKEGCVRMSFTEIKELEVLHKLLNFNQGKGFCKHCDGAIVDALRRVFTQYDKFR